MGEPEEVASVDESATGAYLSDLLGQTPRAEASLRG